MLASELVCGCLTGDSAAAAAAAAASGGSGSYWGRHLLDWGRWNGGNNGWNNRGNRNNGGSAAASASAAAAGGAPFPLSLLCCRQTEVLDFAHACMLLLLVGPGAGFFVCVVDK